jgi:hypothetical protein
LAKKNNPPITPIIKKNGRGTSGHHFKGRKSEFAKRKKSLPCKLSRLSLLRRVDFQRMRIMPPDG